MPHRTICCLTCFELICACSNFQATLLSKKSVFFSVLCTHDFNNIILSKINMYFILLFATGISVIKVYSGTAPPPTPFCLKINTSFSVHLVHTGVCCKVRFDWLSCVGHVYNNICRQLTIGDKLGTRTSQNAHCPSQEE